MPFRYDKQAAMQAHPMWYNGTKYRSKLEAKTAQALDNIGIPYVYEPSGYQLSNGIWYRPDFYLTQCGQFIECKGVMQNKDSAKVVGLVQDTGSQVLVVSYDNAMLVTKFFNLPEESVVTYDEYICIGRCDECDALFFYSLEDTYACPACGAYDGDHLISTVTEIGSGKQLFDYGQEVAADDPVYQRIANDFNV